MYLINTILKSIAFLAKLINHHLEASQIITFYGTIMLNPSSTAFIISKW